MRKYLRVNENSAGEGGARACLLMRVLLVFLSCLQCARFDQVIVLVLNGQYGVPENAHFSQGLRVSREPEISQLLISVRDVILLGPPGRIFCRFPFNSCDSKILSVNPYFPFE